MIVDTLQRLNGMIPVGTSVQSNTAFAASSASKGLTPIRQHQASCAHRSRDHTRQPAKNGVTRAVATTEAPTRPAFERSNQLVREGSYESPLVQHQVRTGLKLLSNLTAVFAQSLIDKDDLSTVKLPAY